MRHLDRDYVLAIDADDALIRLSASVVGISGTTARRDAPLRLLIEEEWRPRLSYLVAILLFPIGLLALLAKARAVLVVEASTTPDGSAQLRVKGRGHEVICDAVLAALSNISTSQVVRE